MTKEKPFKPVFIEARDLDDAWFQLLWNLREFGRGYTVSSGSYAGEKRLAFDYAAGFIHYPHTRPLAPRMPENSPLPPPTTDEEIEKYFTHYLMDSNLAKNEHYRYATWITGGKYRLPTRILIGSDIALNVYHEPIIYVPNAVEWLIRHFRDHGHENEHGYITVGYPESNLAYDKDYHQDTERPTSPCLRGLDFRIVEGRLFTHVIYRSWDLVSGWPTNMGGFALLNQYIAHEVGVEPGPLSFSCKSLHAYGFALDYLHARLGKNQHEF